MKLVKYFACLMFLIFPPFVFAQVPELNVHQFYGDVINGVDGDVVKAVVDNNEFITTVSNGKYGYSPTFNVEGGTSGATVTFYINNVQVATSLYNPQGLTKLDLTKPLAITTAEPPTTTTPPPPTTTPSPTTTSGGGRRRVTPPPTRNITNATAIQPCLESWVCNSWSACINGLKTRECFEESNCGTELLKPATQESCQMAVPAYIAPPVVQPIAPPPKPIPLVEVRKEMPAKEGLNLLWIFILVIAILLVCGVIAVLVYFSFSKKGKSELRQFAPIDRLASLRRYVQKTKAMGYSDMQIRKALSSAGWKPADINTVLPVLKTATPVKTAAKISTRKA